MADTNPNITPSAGLVEGDLFQLLLLPKDVADVDVTLDDITISIKNGDTTDTKTLVDLSTVDIGGTDYYAVSWEVGPGHTQIQAVSASALVATDLAYINATTKPI